MFSSSRKRPERWTESSNWIFCFVSELSEVDSDPPSDSPPDSDPPPEDSTNRWSSGGPAGSPAPSTHGEQIWKKTLWTPLLSCPLITPSFLIPPLGNHNQDKHTDLCKCWKNSECCFNNAAVIRRWRTDGGGLLKLSHLHAVDEQPP